MVKSGEDISHIRNVVLYHPETDLVHKENEVCTLALSAESIKPLLHIVFNTES